MKKVIENLENEKKNVQASLHKAKSLFEVEKHMHNELKRSVELKKKKSVQLDNLKQVLSFHKYHYL